MLGNRHVELEHGRRGRKLARGALGQRETTTGAGEHDLCALVLSELCDTERERCIGEHARDHDALAFEKTHGASDRRCGGDVTALFLAGFCRLGSLRSAIVASRTRAPHCGAPPARVASLRRCGVPPGFDTACARLSRCGSASSAAPAPLARLSALGWHRWDTT